MRSLLVVLIVSGVAYADRTTRIAGTDLTVASTGQGLVVRDKTRSAPFPVRPFGHTDLIIGVDSNVKGDDVSLVLDYNCNGGETIKTTTQILRARLENAAALVLHGKGKWDDAAAGFSRALALDPAFELAALNLASAQARGAHAKEAVATLTKLAQQNLPLVLWRVRVDPDLVPVGRELSAIELSGSDAGAATHTAVVAYSAKRHLIAISESGDDPSGASYRELRIVDATTGKTSTIIGGDKKVDPAIDQTLAALGFAPIAVTEVAVPEGSTDGKARFVFPNTKIGIVLRDRHATIASGNRVLGEGDVASERHPRVALTPEGVVVITHVVIGEGCGGETYDVGTVIRLKP